MGFGPINPKQREATIWGEASLLKLVVMIDEFVSKIVVVPEAK